MGNEATPGTSRRYVLILAFTLPPDQCTQVTAGSTDELMVLVVIPFWNKGREKLSDNPKNILLCPSGGEG
jgi:hypothetical protein